MVPVPYCFKRKRVIIIHHACPTARLLLPWPLVAVGGRRPAAVAAETARGEDRFLLLIYSTRHLTRNILAQAEVAILEEVRSTLTSVYVKAHVFYYFPVNVSLGLSLTPFHISGCPIVYFVSCICVFCLASSDLVLVHMTIPHLSRPYSKRKLIHVVLLPLLLLLGRITNLSVRVY